jgi:hypothetical protein
MISCDEESPLDNLKQLTSRILIHNNKREANALVGDVGTEMLRDLRRVQNFLRFEKFQKPLFGLVLDKKSSCLARLAATFCHVVDLSPYLAFWG